MYYGQPFVTGGASVHYNTCIIAIRKGTDDMKRRVLAVDDSRTVLNMLELYLKNNYVLFCTTSGDQAFNILQKQDIDIILLDIMMPVMNGIMVLKKLRERDEWKDIPVIFLTGDAHRARVIESYLTGSQGYLLKPITKEALLSRIEDTMRKQEQLREQQREEKKQSEEEFIQIQEEMQLETEAAQENPQNIEKVLPEEPAQAIEPQSDNDQSGSVKMPDISKDLQIRQAEKELNESAGQPQFDIDAEDSLLSEYEDAEEVLQNFITSDD